MLSLGRLLSWAMLSGSFDKGTKKSASMLVYISLAFNSWKYGRTLKVHDKRVVQYHKSSIKPLGGLFISSVLTGGGGLNREGELTI